MKHNLLLYLLLTSCIIFITCNTATPEKYFDIAVLNSNMYVDFAGADELGELKYTSAKALDKNNQPVEMTRKEMIESRIGFLEEAYAKVKDLKETDDTKEMLQTSQKLYAYILPVYKNEYTKLAEQYDNGASKEIILSATKDIHTKYHAGFDELYKKLIASGKSYAASHNIKVNWAE